MVQSKRAHAWCSAYVKFSFRILVAIDENNFGFSYLQFSLCLIAVILLEIGVGVAGFVKHQDLDRILQQGFNKTITHYQDNKVAWGLLQREVRKIFWIIQIDIVIISSKSLFIDQQLHCCGVNGPDDWQVVFHNSTLPPECCRNEVPVCDRNDTGNVIGEGCKAILLNLLDSKALIVGAVGLAVAIIQVWVGCCCLFDVLDDVLTNYLSLQLIGLGYSCYLYRAFRRNYESV